MDLSLHQVSSTKLMRSVNSPHIHALKESFRRFTQFRSVGDSGREKSYLFVAAFEGAVIMMG